MLAILPDRMPDGMPDIMSEYVSDGISIGGDHSKKVTEDYIQVSISGISRNRIWNLQIVDMFLVDFEPCVYVFLRFQV